jgi:hypothetical protein
MVLARDCFRVTTCRRWNGEVLEDEGVITAMRRRVSWWSDGAAVPTAPRGGTSGMVAAAPAAPTTSDAR